MLFESDAPMRWTYTGTSYLTCYQKTHNKHGFHMLYDMECPLWIEQYKNKWRQEMEIEGTALATAQLMKKSLLVFLS